ncbi:3'-5' exonuclease domain-containing protein [Pseudozyma hubeiensis]|nr:3'-5' exonuclease domain-containing protein [Pseudozyma hubeiensis]
MRSASKGGRRKLPKTWASTHGDRGPDGGSGSTTSSTTSKRTRDWGRPQTKSSTWERVNAKREKEAKLQELERGLEVYSHKSPAGPPLVSGTPYLNPLCKPSSSSHTLDQPLLSNGSSSRASSPRLKTPMLAYTADHDEANDLLSCLGPGPMGLDLEWNFSRLGGPHRTALLQICSPSMILIIHLSAMSHRIPPLLSAILHDPTIIKTGVAIKNDALKLQRDYGIDTRNVVELSNFVKLAQPQRWAGINHLISLRDLTRIYLGRKLRKDSVRTSDWERYPLDAEQIEYAASDTFASLEVLRAVAEYFRPSGEGRSLLEQLDRMDRDRADEAMDLDQALELSAYDLHLERVHNGREQEAKLRAALREVQAPAQVARSPSPAPVKPAAPTNPPQHVKKASSHSEAQQSSGDDDDFVTVTSVHLAHDRAMSRWLYSSHSITHIASSSKIQPNTVARYLLRALLEAKQKQPQPSLLHDFTAKQRMRLADELKQAGAQCGLSLARYRSLAKSMGWSDAVGSASEGEDEEDASRLGSAKPRKGEGTAAGKAGARAAPTKWSSSAKEVGTKRQAAGEKWSRSPTVVEISDSDEVDVEDDSR